MKRIGDALRETMQLFAAFENGVSVSLDDARGCFVSSAREAAVDVPPFDASVVDGYAVRASDVTTRCALRVEGESRAGGPWPAPLGERTTMRVFTGAPIPANADAVVMQEVVTRDADLARFEHAVAQGASIRRRGSDVTAGDRLLGPDVPVDAGVIGLLASQGYSSIGVRRRPRVGIVTTGDEVSTEPSTKREPLPAGKLHDSNGPMLYALTRDAGAVVSARVHARDDHDDTVAAIEHAYDVSDVVLTVGGISVGDHDLVHAALAKLGVERKLWKVRMKPGKPLAVGVKNRVPIIGLPGNPVSAWVGFEVFVRPGLRRMLGDPRPYRRVVEVLLGASIRGTKDRTELARARIDDDGVAWPHAKQGSSALTSVTNVDALLILPEREREVAVGERVRAMLLDGRGSAQPPFP